MNCERLKSLIKTWYLHVQNETMAPARMVAFMEKHAAECEECLAEEGVVEEIAKIREIVLPPSKAIKARDDDEVDDEDVVIEDGLVDDDEDVVDDDEDDDEVDDDDDEDELDELDDDEDDLD